MFRTETFRKAGLTIMAVIALAVALTGCGSKGSGGSGSGNPSPSNGKENAAAGQPGNQAPGEPKPAPVELIVSAAASMTDALDEVKRRYEAEDGSVTITYNFGASGTLQKQIEQGAPADLFLSAATKNMDALIGQGLIDTGHEGNLLANELVVVVPADAKSSAGSLQELAGTGVKRLAIGIPESVPAGGYAKEALTSAKLWTALQPKTVQGKDVRQVLQYVETGNADAGFVYKTDALTSKKVRVAFAVDPSMYTPIRYPAGIVKGTKHSREAEKLYAYLRSAEARTVFETFGFVAAE